MDWLRGANPDYTQAVLKLFASVPSLLQARSWIDSVS
jgi:hypothetical protein